MSQEKFLCECGKECKTKAGLMSHQRACDFEPQPEPKDIYLSAAQQAIKGYFTDDEVVEVAHAREDVVEYKMYRSIYESIKAEFPWRDSEEFLSELTEVPGLFRDLWLEVDALGRTLFKETSPVDGKLNKPHDKDPRILVYEAKKSKLEKGLDAAWSAMQEKRQERLAEAFEGKTDVLKAIVQNEAWYREQASK